MFSLGNSTEGPVSNILRNKETPLTFESTECVCQSGTGPLFSRSLFRRWLDDGRSTDYFFYGGYSVILSTHAQHMAPYLARDARIGLHTATSEKPRIGLISCLRELYWNADSAHTACCFAYSSFGGRLLASIIWISWGSALTAAVEMLWSWLLDKMCNFCPSKSKTVESKLQLGWFFIH